MEKAYGYSHAVKIGDDLKISGAVSMDDGGNATAIGDLGQQMKNAYAGLDKVAQLKTMVRERGLSTLIQIDGGVNADTINRISHAGVDVFVAGSAIFGSDDYKGTISELKAKW